MDKYQVFAELISNEEKAKEILSESVEETQQNLKKEGLDFTISELKEISQSLMALDQGGELSEDSLDDVAGGLNLVTLGPVLRPTILGPIRPVLWNWLRK